MPISTEELFLPADRASRDRLEHQIQLFLSNPPLVVKMLDAVQDILVILNGDRQIVYANDSLSRIMGGIRVDQVYGKRPGEALGCIHAHEEPYGCGTTYFCRTCGAARAIKASLRGFERLEECTILRESVFDALELRIHSTPIEVDGETFLLVSIADVSNEKQRISLERIFFHDLLNTANNIRNLLDVVSFTDRDETADFNHLLHTQVDYLIDEINQQKELSAAETGDLVVNPSLFDSRKLLEQIVDTYRQRSGGSGARIVVDPDTVAERLVTDKVLLRRVVTNMLLNAMEASSPDETVTVGCTKNDDGVVFWVRNHGEIPNDVRTQIFRRSFSTKGRGRGLGTYSMFLLTNRYLKGRVSFTSSWEEGTTFSVWIPGLLEWSPRRA